MSFETFKSITVEVPTPDGTLYCIIDEKDDRPVRISANFGKAGSALAAWSFALDSMINLLFENGVGVNTIIDNLSRITNNKSLQLPSGVRVGSGPEGYAIALLEYRRQKYREFERTLQDIIED